MASAAGVGEVGLLEFGACGEVLGEFFGELADGGVEVDGGGVGECFELFVDFFGDFGVAVADADGDDAAEAVEVLFAGFVPDVLHFSFDDHERVFVEVEEGGVEVFVAEGDGVGLGGAGVGAGFVRGDGEGDFSWGGGGRVGGGVDGGHGWLLRSEGRRMLTEANVEAPGFRCGATLAWLL